MNSVEKHSRQSFLGDAFLEGLETDVISVIGLGGGGSVVINELAHIGFKNYFICDPDHFEESNLNRLLGARHQDIEDKTAKIDIGKRVIHQIIPDAKIYSYKDIWQNCIDVDQFKNSKLIFSCLDNFANRVQIESFARINKIPLIDIGLRIKSDSKQDYQMMGQVVLSHPSGPCFKCYNFITNKDLEIEALNYGDAGIRPQVIWPNSILASTAVGVGVDLLSGWRKQSLTAFYKHFDGNTLTLSENLKIVSNQFNDGFICTHY